MIERTSRYAAGNRYARRPVLELRLEAPWREPLAPDEVGRLLAALPPMRGEVLDLPAMRRIAKADCVVPVAAAIEVLAVLAQRHVNWPVRFCAWRPGNADDGRAVFEIGTRRVGQRAGALAAETVAAFLAEAGDDPGRVFSENLAALVRATARETPAFDAMLIARAAAARGIPWTTLPRSTYLRLGGGRHAQVVQGSETTKTSSLAREVARRKALTQAVLSSAGLPTATQRLVRRLEDAKAAARAIGFPVVVKPERGNRGNGVTIGVADEAGIAAAFARAQAVSRSVVVETFVAGEETRLLVIDGKFVAAARRRPAQVRGDGVSTVAELVERENARPERDAVAPGRIGLLRPIELDAEAIELLAEQGLTEFSVPPMGDVVLLRRESNVSRGGDSVDVTDLVHPSIRNVAERAASALGIDVCGVDFISRDVGRPWWENGAAICEVNTRPGIVLHARVSEGTNRDVAGEVVRMLFPEGQPVRIPVVAILEGEHSAGIIAAVATAAARAGRRLGVVCRPGTDSGLGPEVQRLKTAASVSWDDSIDVAVVEVSAQQVVRRGLGLERIDLAVAPGRAATTRAAVALARVAGGQLIAAEEPEAAGKVLRALGLGEDGSAVRGDRLDIRQPHPPKSPGDFTVLMVGDVGFGESYLGHRRAVPLRNILSMQGRGHCFARLQPMLDAADLSIGNLEAPLAGRPDERLQGAKNYLGWSDPEPATQALKAAGFSAVSLANNHALDCGVPGLDETLRRLSDSDIAAFGAGDDREAAGRPFVIRFAHGGIERSLVVFGGFEHRPRYERRFRWYAQDGSPGVSGIDVERMGETIARLREQLPAPFFVAYPHWGNDYEGVVGRQRNYAAALIDAGIDLIVGHGSHTAQAVEILGNRVVVYGLGNFVWNTPGRYRKLNAKPYGLAVTLGFHAARRDMARLRLYPILTDNRRTEFQSRPVTGAEFDEVAHDLTARLQPTPRTASDAIGLFLELDLMLAPQGQGLQPRGLLAGVRSARAGTPGIPLAMLHDGRRQRNLP